MDVISVDLFSEYGPGNPVEMQTLGCQNSKTTEPNDIKFRVGDPAS